MEIDLSFAEQAPPRPPPSKPFAYILHKTSAFFGPKQHLTHKTVRLSITHREDTYQHFHDHKGCRDRSKPSTTM
uniref:Uncharacterized protein n=1 Tax=Arundo donax TaxID=35708 RepID=A0A0A9F694_ARUDO